MAIIDISPEEAQRPYLTGGDYGPGLTNEADVELTRFEYPAEERPCPWDKEGINAYFGFKIVDPKGRMFFADKWAKPNELKKLLLACGVNIQIKEGGGFTFDGGDVAPRKLKGIKLGDAKEWNGEMQTGRVNAILS